MLDANEKRYRLKGMMFVFALVNSIPRIITHTTSHLRNPSYRSKLLPYSPRVKTQIEKSSRSQSTFMGILQHRLSNRSPYQNNESSRRREGVKAFASKNDSEELPLFESPLFWRGAVLFLCILWSTNFATAVTIFNAVPGLSPEVYSTIRFGIAAIILAPAYVDKLKDVELVGKTFLIGALLFLGFLGQAVGLSVPGASADKSAFLASLVVVWTAVVQAFFLQYLPVSEFSRSRGAALSKGGVLAIVLSVLGIGVLEIQGVVPPTWDDLWLCLQVKVRH